MRFTAASRKIQGRDMVTGDMVPGTLFTGAVFTNGLRNMVIRDSSFMVVNSGGSRWVVDLLTGEVIQSAYITITADKVELEQIP